jgi:hypothetical protein
MEGCLGLADTASGKDLFVGIVFAKQMAQTLSTKFYLVWLTLHFTSCLLTWHAILFEFLFLGLLARVSSASWWWRRLTETIRGRFCTAGALSIFIFLQTVPSEAQGTCLTHDEQQQDHHESRHLEGRPHGCVDWSSFPPQSPTTTTTTTTIATTAQQLQCRGRMLAKGLPLRALLPVDGYPQRQYCTVRVIKKWHQVAADATVNLDDNSYSTLFVSSQVLQQTSIEEATIQRFVSEKLV